MCCLLLSSLQLSPWFRLSDPPLRLEDGRSFGGAFLWHALCYATRMEQTLLTKKQAREQGLKHYFTGKPCKHGHIAPRYVSNCKCFECTALLTKKRREDDPSAYAEQTAKSNAKKRVSGYWRSSAYKKTANRHKSRIRGKQARKKARDNYIDLVNKSPERLLARRLRTRLYKAIKAANTAKQDKTLEFLGCSAATAMNHLEAQFLPGMTWDNYGEWHIDHIRPCASFDLTDPAQQRECFHYTNLQPLWAKDNLSKSDKWEEAA